MDHIGCNASPSPIVFPCVVAYNIYKTKDKNNNKKFIFLVGQQRSSKMRMYSMANAIRQWNLHRLKSDMCKEVNPKRIHKHV